MDQKLTGSGEAVGGSVGCCVGCVTEDLGSGVGVVAEEKRWEEEGGKEVSLCLSRSRRLPSLLASLALHSNPIELRAASAPT